jgi:hypothetical protein
MCNVFVRSFSRGEDKMTDLVNWGATAFSLVSIINGYTLTSLCCLTKFHSAFSVTLTTSVREIVDAPRLFINFDNPDTTLDAVTSTESGAEQVANRVKTMLPVVGSKIKQSWKAAEGTAVGERGIVVD